MTAELAKQEESAREKQRMMEVEAKRRIERRHDSSSTRLRSLSDRMAADAFAEL
jgi:hypothetical protein